MITLKNLKKVYKKEYIYKSSNCTFPDKAISFLMGKNGSGKTTLIKCIAGLEEYDGEILFNDKLLSKVKNECFVIWDDSPCFNNLSGMQNLFILGEEKKDKKTIGNIAEKYLDKKTLKRKVKSYSYGQRKKLMLALADILEPRYLIMDEVSNGLDVDMMDELASHLLIMKEKSTIILTGHQFSFYEKIAEHIFFKTHDTIEYISESERKNKRLEELYHDKLS